MMGKAPCVNRADLQNFMATVTNDFNKVDDVLKQTHASNTHISNLRDAIADLTQTLKTDRMEQKHHNEEERKARMKLLRSEAEDRNARDAQLLESMDKQKQNFAESHQKLMAEMYKVHNKPPLPTDFAQAVVAKVAETLHDIRTEQIPTEEIAKALEKSETFDNMQAVLSSSIEKATAGMRQRLDELFSSKPKQGEHQFCI